MGRTPHGQRLDDGHPLVDLHLRRPAISQHAAVVRAVADKSFQGGGLQTAVVPCRAAYGQSASQPGETPFRRAPATTRATRPATTHGRRASNVRRTERSIGADRSGRTTAFLRDEPGFRTRSNFAIEGLSLKDPVLIEMPSRAGSTTLPKYHGHSGDGGRMKFTGLSRMGFSRMLILERSALPEPRTQTRRTPDFRNRPGTCISDDYFPNRDKSVSSL